MWKFLKIIRGMLPLLSDTVRASCRIFKLTGRLLAFYFHLSYLYVLFLNSAFSHTVIPGHCYVNIEGLEIGQQQKHKSYKISS